ncbi:sugar transferase [Liquorilactobacillus oeni]|uniref:Sugar transferase n=1 Tax=Liquorilactobacillus oeni DSM 19972 TaxID=1423777 RepID=A0A0R1M8V9_9LACO|nr:sugar transferase [Liquorilactobacillus oeni]KRL04574.1 sugar transferase [Liquorilactobacillus oeni DSM 19972]
MVQESVHLTQDSEYTFKSKLKKPIKNNYLLLKRTFDVVLCSFLLFTVLPLIGLTMLFIRLESSGKVIYSQNRVGYMGHIFKIYKLRSMVSNAEKDGKAVWAVKNDVRITRVGRFIRKTRIDELPQLLNVIRGDMSLIGPRPERPEFTEKFSLEYPGFEQRLRVKPGLTGFAQINGGYELNPQKKATLDMKYINTLNFKFDLKIFVETFKIIFTGDGAR